ncbi:hypothetical protein [Glycomyces algeriensis]|uniref:DUF4386 family protein n=1 Tax=Glycomyces algeriensis TaxID=256037 RepID=A0A9W6LFT5_9ACTN|nr:hypothetical protein [Glycomyces algeriensis]MDA1365980.1 hypothetical protein [Glycomyces algeriensis]MDR7349253.1 putative membrane protein [Glycomyces algeriensis]GLI41953.1 hypothetical protein GALLR39Z86_18030 [Glycomyces algeriensis]
MPKPPTDPRARMGALAFALAGVLFLIYEAAAPRADQTTLEGAESWTSAGWSIAHIAAIVGLILFPLGYGALRAHLGGTRNEQTAMKAATIGYIGSALTISYYGAEVYGLKAIGQRAVEDGDASMTEVGDAFRYDPTAMSVFAIGLVLIAVAAVLAAVAVWRSGTLNKWSAVPLAALLVTMLPQYFLPHAGRIAWGALVLVAALWLAAEMWRAPAKAPERELQDA